MARSTILYVEDCPEDRELAARALRRTGMSVELVLKSNGVEALEYLFGAADAECRAIQLPRVVLLDLDLPRMTGLEVLERVRSSERTRTLPVVVLSSSDNPAAIAKSYALGANGYVRKPADYCDFEATLGRLGVYWVLVNQTCPEIRGVEA